MNQHPATAATAVVALIACAAAFAWWAVRRRRPVGDPARVVVVGGGYVGCNVARRLQRRLRRGEASVTVVDPRPTMTYQPFLAEVAAGNIEPRHVVVSLRRVLRRCRVVTAHVTAIDHDRRCITLQPGGGPAYELGYDHVVIGLGSMTHTLPVAGLADVAFGFKQVEEAVVLRNQVLERLDVAGATADRELRHRALAFVVIGAGYAGVELVAELEAMARAAIRYHATIEAADVRWVVIEASDRILPEVSKRVGEHALSRLRRRGVTVLLGTRLLSCVAGHAVLSDGQTFDSDTIVWTAGVRPHPSLATSELPVDERGRVVAEPTLAVVGVHGAWAAGDNGAVPDLTKPGALCSPSAQHAARQAKVLADNIVCTLRGHPRRDYRHRHAGSVASLGRHDGVAQIYGVRLRGWPAWLVHRTYHLAKMPTWDRRMRIALDWAAALFFRRDVVSLGRLQRPRAAFERAARRR